MKIYKYKKKRLILLNCWTEKSVWKCTDHDRRTGGWEMQASPLVDVCKHLRIEK
jgi:hypothetical protein